MLKVTLLEFFLRGIPEGLVFFLAAYASANNKIKWDKYLISVFIQAVLVYIIRLLPIHNGADSILNLILFICILVIVNKFEVIQSIKAAIIIMIIEFICEGLNVFFLQFILKKDMNSLFKDPTLKILYTTPSLIIFGAIAIIYYKKRDEINSLWKKRLIK